jgi:hypothetical protein
MTIFKIYHVLFIPKCFDRRRHHHQCNLQDYKESKGQAVAQLVEALRYKSEGRGFDS